MPLIPNKDELIKIYIQDGNSLEQTAKILNVSRPTVKKWLIGYGIPIKSHLEASRESNNRENKPIRDSVKYAHEKLKDYNWLYEQRVISKKSKEQIAREIGCSVTLINNYLLEYNIEKKRNEPNTKIKLPTQKDLEELYINQKKSFLEISSIFGVSNVTVKKWISFYNIPIRTLSENQKITHLKVKTTKQKKYGYECFPEQPNIIKKSKGELEVKDFLNSLGFNFETKFRCIDGKYDLDLFDKNINVAIEYNGENYHCERFPDKDKFYHKRKYDYCKKYNIQLIMINDLSEWQKRNKQVKSFLKAKLGIFEKRIYARRTCVIEITKEVARKFIDEVHIQGAPNTIDSAFGLFFGEELIGVVSFGKHHRINDKIVLNRLCFKSGYQCIGGASKLVINAIKNKQYDNIITWSDNRWTDGEIYKTIGFKFDGDLPPDYCYVNSHRIASKQSRKKSAINCPSNLTEVEYNRQLGWYRMWDCGKKRWVWEQNVN